MAREFSLKVEECNGLWTITSRSAVDQAMLLVAEHSLETALAAVPGAIRDLEAAKVTS